MARLSAKGFQAEMQALAASLRRQIETDCQAFPTDAEATAARQAAARDPQTGFRYFCQTYFPHYLTAAPGALHEFLFEFLPALVADPKGRKLALACRAARPRAPWPPCCSRCGARSPVRNATWCW